MSVYLIQPSELSGTYTFILGTEAFRKTGTRIVIQMEVVDPLAVKAAILARFQEWYTVKDERVEGDPRELRSLFYHAVLTYEDTRPVKMDIDEPSIVKYLEKVRV